jgi:hypothetical protein
MKPVVQPNFGYMTQIEKLLHNWAVRPIFWPYYRKSFFVSNGIVWFQDIAKVVIVE